MTRARPEQFHYRELEELTRQLSFLPTLERGRQVQRAETLHDRTDPDQQYPLEFVIYHVTGERPVLDAGLVLEGRKLREDLRLLIDRASRSSDLPAPEHEAIHTPPELARKLHVSLKTVWRYRNQGLRWRWFTRPGGARRQVGFTQSAVDHFLQTHGQQAQRAARFTHLSPLEKQRIIDRARRIAQQRDVTLNQVALHLARRVGRSAQTIRLVLQRHDSDHPGSRIFMDRTAPLDARQKRVIARAHRWGVPLGMIARRFGRTRSTIYRAINDHRASALRRVAIEYVSSPLFARPDADELILSDSQPMAPEAEANRPAARPPLPMDDDLPAALRELLASAEPIAPERERALLVQFNYLKHRADQVRRRLHRYEPRASDLDRIEQDLRRAGAIRGDLFRLQLPVVLTAARRHLAARPQRSLAELVELLDEGLRVLAESIDSFDITRGQTLEAYATWNLMKRFAEMPVSSPRAHRRFDAGEAVRRLRAVAAALGVTL